MFSYPIRLCQYDTIHLQVLQAKLPSINNYKLTINI